MYELEVERGGNRLGENKDVELIMMMGISSLCHVMSDSHHAIRSQHKDSKTRFMGLRRAY